MYFLRNKTTGTGEMITSRMFSVFSVSVEGLVGTDTGWNGATEVVTEDGERRLT